MNRQISINHSRNVVWFAIGLTPLDANIKQEAMFSCFRLQVNSQWVSSVCSHTSIKNTLQQIVSVSHKQCDRIIVPRYMFDRNYVVKIISRSDWIGNNVELKYDIVCYTDGSRMESRTLTGASVFDETHN